MRVYYSLYGRLLSLQSLYDAFKRVKKNKGAAGIDGQSVQDFERNLENNLKQLLFELQEKRYQPQPVKRVEIDKDDGGKRLLGIPVVRDRVVQQCLSNIMTPHLRSRLSSIQLWVQSRAKLSSSHQQGDAVYT